MIMNVFRDSWLTKNETKIEIIIITHGVKILFFQLIIKYRFPLINKMEKNEKESLFCVVRNYISSNIKQLGLYKLCRYFNLKFSLCYI